MIPYKQAVREFKRGYWVAALAENGGRPTRAAKAAKVNRTFLYKVLNAFGIPYVHDESRGPGNWGDLSNEEHF
jgi:DNA-binding NtrC family response regulator